MELLALPLVGGMIVTVRTLNLNPEKNPRGLRGNLFRFGRMSEIERRGSVF